MVTSTAHVDPVLILVALLFGLIVGFTFGYTWHDDEPSEP